MAYTNIKKSVKPTKLSDVILARLESMILEGSVSPGEKLPPERELALQFDVSRPSLREAIQKLEAKGLVTRKQGVAPLLATLCYQGCQIHYLI